MPAFRGQTAAESVTAVTAKNPAPDAAYASHDVISATTNEFNAVPPNDNVLTNAVTNAVTDSGTNTVTDSGTNPITYPAAYGAYSDWQRSMSMTYSDHNHHTTEHIQHIHSMHSVSDTPDELNNELNNDLNGGLGDSVADTQALEGTQRSLQTLAQSIRPWWIENYAGCLDGQLSAWVQNM
jgi:hypothetical protein